MPATILVTGPTGTVASGALSALAARGVWPRALSREPKRAAAQLGALAGQVDLLAADLDDAASIEADGGGRGPRNGRHALGPAAGGA